MPIVFLDGITKQTNNLGYVSCSRVAQTFPPEYVAFIGFGGVRRGVIVSAHQGTSCSGYLRRFIFYSD